MPYGDKKSCLTCAWRETCQKRFSSIEDMGSRCPEYTYDVRLDKQMIDKRAQAQQGQDSPAEGGVKKKPDAQ